MNSVAQICQAAENIKKLSPNLLLNISSSGSSVFPKTNKKTITITKQH